MAGLHDVLVRKLRKAPDPRGWFYEGYRADSFYDWTGLRRTIMQTNVSHSVHGVLRGLHYQTRHPQGKLVWVVAGEIYDVAVDLRKGSPDFGRWKAFTLSAANQMQAWIPEGFAHGFLVTGELAEVVYQTTDIYDPESERVLWWADPRVSIEWPLDPGELPLISNKDAEGLRLTSCPVFP